MSGSCLKASGYFPCRTASAVGNSSASGDSGQAHNFGGSREVSCLNVFERFARDMPQFVQ